METTEHLRSRGQARPPLGRVQLYIPRGSDEAIWKEARGRSWAQGVSLSSLVTQALAEYFKTHPKGASQSTTPEATR